MEGQVRAPLEEMVDVVATTHADVLVPKFHKATGEKSTAYSNTLHESLPFV